MKNASNHKNTRKTCYELQTSDRSKIEVLYQEGYTASQIAEAIERHCLTIYRELKRVESALYNAQLAQANATERQSLKGRRPKHTPELIQDIQTKLELTWSPEQIVGRCYQNRLSFKTIYNWIYQVVIKVSINCLRQKGKRRKAQEIRGKSKGCLATFAECKSRFYIALKTPNRSKESMLSTVNQLIQSFPKRTDLAKITKHKLFNALWLVNNQPRKCLDFKMLFGVLMHKLVQLE